MKKSIIICSALAAFCCVAAHGAKIAPAPEVRCDTVFVSGDSLLVGLHIEARGLKVRGLQALTLTPVVRAGQSADGEAVDPVGNFQGGTWRPVGETSGQKERLDLPPVVYSGTKRARFDRRAELVDPIGTQAAQQIAPYVVYKPVKKSKTYVTEYRVRTPYEAWMAGGTLELERWLHNCCSDNKQGDNQVLADNIGSVRQAQPASAPEVAPVAAEEWAPNADYAAYMVTFLTPEVETVKLRSQSVEAHIDFKQGSSQIFPDFGRNPRELMVVDTLVRNVTGNDLIQLNSIDVVGFASPEGKWEDNNKLARNRSIGFKNFMVQKYGLADTILRTNSVAEDWDGLTKMLEASNMKYKDQVLNIIKTVDVFDYREKKIMLIAGGAPYREMLRDMFPPLRRIEVKADFTVLPVAEKDLRRTLFTQPNLLSLDEMFRAAAGMTPGTEEYQKAYEIAARYFPNDVVANNNAAAAALLNGDLTSSRYFLGRTGGDPRAFNNLGVLSYLDGDRETAATWFEQAADTGDGKGADNMRYVVVQ